MRKLTKHDYHFMRVALEIARASKCVRAQYGTVIVSQDGRIVSSGRNGKPRGSINDDVCYREGLPPSAAKPNCCQHSEVNAIMFSNPIDRAGATLYVTGAPCIDCSLAIMQSGIRRVVFLNEGMHAGMTHDDVWYAYGFGADRIERIPMLMLNLKITDTTGGAAV